METPYVGFYKKEYLQDVAALFYCAFTAPPWNYAWLIPEKIRVYFQDLEADPKFLGFVLWDGKPENKKIIGACLGSVSDYFTSSQYDIKEFFVQADLQSKGLGSWFLQAVEARLKEKNVDCVALYTQRSTAAFRFYLKNGYEAVEDIAMLTKPLL